jgi:protein-L-isoaspartate(D-aspartate) O-methyltransferase
LLEEAIGRFDLLGLNNINTKFDDGIKGWKSYAPYDRILFSASTKEIPKHLFEQLNENGILVAPIEKNGKQVITKFVKRRGRVETHEIEECLFVPVVEGVKKSI